MKSLTSKISKNQRDRWRIRSIQIKRKASSQEYLDEDLMIETIIFK
jgi:hypothetical protein